jgi:hypothetical protein
MPDGIATTPAEHSDSCAQCRRDREQRDNLIVRRGVTSSGEMLGQAKY